MHEHLMRADEVERLEALEDHEGDTARIHPFTLPPAQSWRQRQLTHDSRHSGRGRCRPRTGGRR
jgi:hypothetical protein